MSVNEQILSHSELDNSDEEISLNYHLSDNEERFKKI